MDLDVQLHGIGDDMVLPEAEAFPTTAHQAPAAAGILDALQERSSSESAEAPLPRKRRALKQLPVDEVQELHNIDLAQWKTDYLENMAEATAAKLNHKAPFLAKKNAAFWVVGTGIGGVGAALGSSKLRSPLDIFAGDAMIEALTGVKVATTGQKRGRDDEEDPDPDSKARRVRIRDGNGDQAGRGVDEMDNEGTMMIQADDVSISRSCHLFPAMTMTRESKLVAMLLQRSKMPLCRGTSAQPWALVKRRSFTAGALPAVLVGFLPVLAVVALCHPLLRVPPLLIDAPVEYPAPVLLSAAGIHVTAVSSFLLARMKTIFSAVGTSLMIQPLMTFNFMVPLPP